MATNFEPYECVIFAQSTKIGTHENLKAIHCISYTVWYLHLIGWLVVLGINVDLAIFQPYLDLEAGDNQSLKIQVARPGIEPRSSFSASQEFNINIWYKLWIILKYIIFYIQDNYMFAPCFLFPFLFMSFLFSLLFHFIVWLPYT